MLTTAVDIWSLGVLVFVLRTNCLPLVRDSQNKKFDLEGIINSQQYHKVFDEDTRDFLSKCLKIDPKSRATADQLLLHSWIVKNEKERQAQLANAKEMRQNFAIQVKQNYHALESISEFEGDILTALNNNGLLEDHLAMANFYFEACDIDKGPDGRVSFDEILKAVEGTGVFASKINDPEFEGQEDVVTLE